MSDSSHPYFLMIASGQLTELVQALQTDAGISLKIQEEATLVSGRLSYLSEQIHRNTISPEEANRERSRISEALMVLVNQLLAEKDHSIRKRRNLRSLLSITVYVCIGVLIIWFLFSPRKNVRIEADLSVSRITLIYHQGNLDLVGRELSKFRFKYFAHAYLPGEQYALAGDTEDSWSSFRVLPKSSVIVTPFVESGNVTLPINSPGYLSALPLYSGAQLTFIRSQNPNESDRVELIVSQDSGVNVRFSYWKYLDLKPEQVQVEGIPNYSEFLGPIRLRIHGPDNSRREVIFQTQPDLFSLIMYLEDTLLIDGSSLHIERPSFYQKDPNLSNKEPISSILGGTIWIKENRKEPLRELPILEGEEWNLTGKDMLQLEKMTIRPSGIHLRFNGKVHTLRKGMTRDIQNPNWWEWLWHNHKALVIVLGMFWLVLIFVLPGPIKDVLLNIIRTPQRLS